jgi:uncharacterized membrane protein YccC
VNPSGWHNFKALIRREVSELTTVHRSDRPWQMPLAAALATGLPLVIAAYFDRMAEGVIASLAGLVFLYLPATRLHRRMGTLVACAFCMTTCYAIGLLSHLIPFGAIPLLTVTSILITAICRFYRLRPPGSLFFIMTAAIGAFSPGSIAQAPYQLGIFTLGSIGACGVAFVYSLIILRKRPPSPAMSAEDADRNLVWTDAVVVGGFVGLSLLAAQGLSLPKAYWVPVSCLAVMQGMSIRAAWNRQVHRILGTAIGLALTWALLQVTRDNWSIAIALIVLTFLIEAAVVRHYGFAAIFITPLTILLAEAPTLGQTSSAALIQARFLDTVLGAVIGFAGAACLHSRVTRERISRMIHRLRVFARGDG